MFFRRYVWNASGQTVWRRISDKENIETCSSTSKSCANVSVFCCFCGALYTLARPATAFLSDRTRAVVFQIEFNRNDFCLCADGVMDKWKIRQSEFRSIGSCCYQQQKKNGFHSLKFLIRFLKPKSPQIGRSISSIQLSTLYSLQIDPMQMRANISSGRPYNFLSFDFAMSLWAIVIAEFRSAV